MEHFASDFFFPLGHGELEFSDDVVGVTSLGAEPEVDDHGAGRVVVVAGLGPVLGALDAVVLLQVRQHDDDLHALLINHPPEVRDGVFQRALGADPVLAILVAADKVGVDVVGAFLVFNFGEVDSRFVVTFDVWVAIFRSGKKSH